MTGGEASLVNSYLAFESWSGSVIRVSTSCMVLIPCISISPDVGLSQRLWPVTLLSQPRHASVAPWSPPSFFLVWNQLVWEAFTEVRRPQHSLVRDFLSGVLHPVHLAMPVLNGVALSADEVGGIRARQTQVRRLSLVPHRGK